MTGVTEETNESTSSSSEPELDVGPPEAPDIHVTPHPSILAGSSAEQLPAFTRWLLVGVAIAAAFLAAAYAPT